jgi:hypothetical protein
MGPFKWRLLQCESAGNVGCEDLHNSVAHHLALDCMFNFGLNTTAARFQFERFPCKRVLVLLPLRSGQNEPNIQNKG